MFGTMIVIRCSINPKLGPPVEEKVTWGQRFAVLKEVWPLPMLILGVIGGMYSGAFTWRATNDSPRSARAIRSTSRRLASSAAPSRSSACSISATTSSPTVHVIFWVMK